MAKIVIIGGGVSGLSAGIYARLKGHRAIVCEKHFIPGGNLTGWDRGGYHIDNCIHWLTGTNPRTGLYKMWEELGALGDVKVYQSESLYTCEYKGRSLSLYKDLYKLKSEMLNISPADKKEIRSFIKAVEILQGLFGIAGKKHDKGLSFSGGILMIPTLVKYYKLSAGDLARKFKSPLLGSFITSFFGDDFGSLALLFVIAHFCGENAGLPEGGSTTMAAHMTERFAGLGGELLLKKEAVKVNHEKGKAKSVSFSDGTVIDADYVIITADPATVYNKLLDLPMPKKMKDRYSDPAFARFSSYQCAFACDSEELPFTGDLIFEARSEEGERLPIKQVILREFSHEKSFSPEGKSIIQTMTFCDERTSKSFIRLREKHKDVYDRKKLELSEMMRLQIERRFPELRGKLRLLDVWTPATYKRFVNSEMGSWMSFVLPKKVLPIRESNRVPELSNVLLANQWQQIPGGLPIAAEGGKIAVETVTKLERCERAKSKIREKINSKKIKSV